MAGQIEGPHGLKDVASTDPSDEVNGTDINDLNKSHERIITWDGEDLREYGRLERRHAIIKALLDNQLHQTPLQCPQRILDCSSGSGCWALEACAQYPTASVTGLDMSGLHCVGPLSNRLNFQQGSICDRLPFADCTFDLVHCQAVQSQITEWASFVSELYRVVEPGGWVQLVEPDASGVRSEEASQELGPALVRWNDICRYAAVIMGQETNVHAQVSHFLKSAGFDRIKDTTLTARSFVPSDSSTSSSDTLVAKLLKRDMTESVRNCGKEALQTLSSDQTEEEIQTFIKEVVHDLKHSVHWSLEYRGVTGRRPVD